MRNAALIVAAGRGTRAQRTASQEGEPPKQYTEISGQPVLARALEPFLRHPDINMVMAVIHPEDREHYVGATRAIADALLPPALGGPTRQSSVLNGLEALAPHGPDRVLIHDGARPFLDRSLIDRTLAALSPHKGVVAGTPVTDTLKRANPAGLVLGTVERKGLWRAQTPQGFHFAEILAAHRAAAAAAIADFSDDAAVAEWHGIEVALVLGSEQNRKLTTAEDLEVARRDYLAAAVSDVRVGTGFDVHRFMPGNAVWLCGLRIPHTHSLEGHSDADVGLHALTDALLGAVGDGDIGAHFPPSDARWRGASSALFVQDAAKRVATRGGTITNVDVTLLCEAPKIGPYREAMRARIAEMLALDVARVSVKATTTEGLGFTGRREGIAAMASATVMIAP